MSNATRRRLTTGMSILLVMAQLGCAARGVRVPPPSEQVRAQLGTIGVASAQFAPRVEYRTPPKGRAAAAGRGALAGAGVGLSTFPPGGGLAGLLWLVFVTTPLTVGGSMVGAVHGAVTAQSAEDVETAEAVLKNIFVDLKIQEALGDRVLHVARAGTDSPVIFLEGRGPTTVDDKPDYRTEASEGITSVLEVRMFTVALAPTSMTPNIGNPTLQLHVTAGARLIRTLDGAELFSQSFFHRGGSSTFAGWAEKDAERLREALSLAAAELAKEIVEELGRAPSEPVPSKNYSP